MKQHYRAVFISDVHLCSKDSQAEKLADFLHHIKCEKLYIVGDFVDVWQLSRKWFWDPSYNEIFRKLIKMTQKGTEIIFIPGNHDEGFRHHVGHSFGSIRLEMRTEHTTLTGKRFLVTHGDEFDAIVMFNKWLAMLGSAAYDWLLYLNRFINFFRRIIGLEHWSLAAHMKRKIKNAGIYIDRFQSSAISVVKHGGFDGIICGHIHTPVIKEYEGCLYCNTGDWVDSCSALVEDQSGTLKLIYYKDVLAELENERVVMA